MKIQSFDLHLGIHGEITFSYPLYSNYGVTNLELLLPVLSRNLKDE